MVHRQIEKLQTMVNGLLGLCAGSGTDAAPEAIDPTAQDTRHERLGILILKAQDGELEARYFRRMEQWLLCDPDAMRYYVDFQSLTAMLSMHFNPEQFSKQPFRQQALV